MYAIQENISHQDILEVFNGVNINPTEDLNYNEFIAATMWAKVRLDGDKISEVVKYIPFLLDPYCCGQIFDTLDRDKAGYLDVETILASVGLDFGEEEVINMVHDLDMNNDDKVELQDMMKVWKQQSIANPERYYPYCNPDSC